MSECHVLVKVVCVTKKVLSPKTLCNQVCQGSTQNYHQYNRVLLMMMQTVAGLVHSQIRAHFHNQGFTLSVNPNNC